MRKQFFIFSFLLIAIAFIFLFNSSQSIGSDGLEKSSITIEKTFDKDIQLACSNCYNYISNDFVNFKPVTKSFDDSNRITSFKKQNLFNSIFKIDEKNYYKHYFIYRSNYLNILRC